MLKTRVIPSLLLKNDGLVKTVKFKNPKYVGDPINAIKIFNEKEVDELIFLDIEASSEGRSPSKDLIRNIASECFMPFCYGGGINDLDTIKEVLKLGVEKISINSKALESPEFIKDATNRFGSSTIVVSIDIKKNLFGKYKLYSKHCKIPKIEPLDFALKMEEYGAGELMINAVHNDGTMTGYDEELIKHISARVGIPIIASGGAGSIQDLSNVTINAGASAAAAGSLFVFQGKHRAVLITYPSQDELRSVGF